MEKIKIDKKVFRRVFQFGYITGVSGCDFFEAEASSRLPNHMTRLDAEAEVVSEIADRIMDIAGDFGFELIETEYTQKIDHCRFNYNLQVDDITQKDLEEDGWKFIEKDIFTGKPTWVKNEVQHNDWISYKFYLTLNDYQNISTIRFSGGEFSTVQRAIETIQQVRDFVKVLE